MDVPSPLQPALSLHSSIKIIADSHLFRHHHGLDQFLRAFLFPHPLLVSDVSGGRLQYRKYRMCILVSSLFYSLLTLLIVLLSTIGVTGVEYQVYLDWHVGDGEKVVELDAESFV